MKYGPLVAVLIAVIFLTVVLTSATASQPDGRALVRITCRNRADLSLIQEAGVPVYARLAGGGEPRLLAGATSETVKLLRRQGLEVTVLDPDIRGARYYLVYPGPGHARPDWAAYGRVLLDDSAQALLRTSSEEAGRLAEAGAELKAITFDAKPLQPAQVGAIPRVGEPDPFIQEMLAQVDSSSVYSYTGDLSGEWPVMIGGEPFTITTRHTYSGVPIQKATQYAGEHLSSLGLDIEYHEWGGATYPNVIGELTGQTNPEDVYIITAHIDDLPSGVLAPGADDNASGTTAVLVAADILTQYQWDCTLRFALFTGEEQGLLGSAAYAQRAYSSGESILGVLNLDMIAWNTADSSPDIDLHARSSLPATLDLADVFSDVVSTYDLDLIPQIIENGVAASDHASFWSYGYAAILGIEDYYPNRHDFNPYYHTVDDHLEALDMGYYTDFVKASVAAFAHMSDCLIPADAGYLDGYVTSASDGAPIIAATVSITDSFGYSYPEITDGSGYYTSTLPAGTYTVTASAGGYLPAPAGSATILTDVVTTRDFSLQPLPSIVVGPPALTATLGPVEVATQTLWITNTGKGDLTFALHELNPISTAAPLSSPGSLPWLSEIPEAGTLAPAEGMPVAVIFDAGGLDAPGTSLGLLDVESNDPISPHVEISVTLTVEPFYFHLPIAWQGG
jgi:hypothetical protein